MRERAMTLAQTFFNLDILAQALPALLRGLITTVVLGVGGILFGTAGGLLVALLRLFAPQPVRAIAVIYVDIFRAAPILVVLILIYYALPFLDIRFSSWTSALMALSIVMAAYQAEVFRAGIEAVPKGQFEAASALGLPFAYVLLKVVLPQAIRIVIPPTASNFVSLFKDTSLASVVALPELLKEANDAQALYANPSPLIGAAIVYLALLWPMVRVVTWLENRAKKERGR
jgi:polar amino acid transport system permease protein